MLANITVKMVPLANITAVGAPEEVLTRCPVDLAFNIPLILDKILKYLPAKDLLQCSAVNNRWYLRSRSILYDLKKCFARTDRVATCADLIPWYMEISEMSIPFNGLSISFSHWRIHNSDACSQDQEIPEEFFRTEWPLKYLQINGIQNSCVPHCAAARFVKRVLETKSLTELEITQSGALCYVYAPWRVIFSCEVVLPFTIAKLPEQVIRHSQYLLRPFISSSPNLMQLDCYVTPKNVAFIPGSRYGILKKLKFDVTSLSDYMHCYKFCNSGPKLEGLHVENRTPVCGMGETGVSSWRSLEKILNSSSKSLRSLEVTIPVLVKFPHLNIAPLFNVTELKIDAGGSYLDRQSLAMFKKFNFSQFFPSLTSVVVDATEQKAIILEMDSRKNEFEPSQSANLAANINRVSFRGPIFRVAGYFVRIFPNVTAAELSHGCTSLESFRAILAHWGLLREITLGKGLRLSPVQLDAAFCGIAQKEAIRLQRRGAGFLRDVNIVPNYLGLWHLTNLRQLKLSKELLCVDNDNGPVLTQVTQFVAFQRMKNLKISYLED